MSLEKAIESGKEKRKKYQGAKRFCKSCRNGGTCPYCQGNRHYQSRKELEKMLDKEKDM